MSIDNIGARSHAFRILAVFLAAFLTVGFASAANAVSQPVTVCHVAGHKYEQITIDDDGQANGHADHVGDMVLRGTVDCPPLTETETDVDDGDTDTDTDTDGSGGGARDN